MVFWGAAVVATTTNTTTTTTTIPSYRSIQIEPDQMDDNDNIDYLSESSLHSSNCRDDDDDDDQFRNDHDDTVPNRHGFLSSSPSPPPLSILAAALALMKGNLGPGILNLPHAFSRLYSSCTNGNSRNDSSDQEISPTLVIVILFSIVTAQGLYSMALLVYCKNVINQYQAAQPSLASAPPAVAVTTFMDVTKVTFGSRGGRITETLIFVVQIGVCCVFISLISTNIQVFVQPMMTITPFISVSFITLFFIITVTIFRYIHDLFYFNAIANTFMLVAILTVTITSIIIIIQQQHHDKDANLDEATSIAGQQQERRDDVDDIDNGSQQDSSSSSSSAKFVFVLLQAAITFIADLFFAFEGIGLVLPVENNYNSTNDTTAVTPISTNIYSSSPNQEPYEHLTNSVGHTIRRTLLSAEGQISGSNLDNIDDGNYHLHNQQQAQQKHRWTFTSVLLLSMGSVAILFAIIGFTSSIAFQHVNGNVGIQNASITAFLQESYPNNSWFPVVNVMVVLAVALTFPLQLTPAIEVLDKWILECRSSHYNLPHLLRSRYHYFHPHLFPSGTISRTDSDDNMMLQQIDRNVNTVGNRSPARATTGDGIFTNAPNIDLTNNRNHFASSPSSTTPTSVSVTSSLCSDYGWIIRRWIVVISCSGIVLAVNDLGLLVSLFGAVGQTGLAAMPCAVHLALQYQQRIAPKSTLLSIADILVLLFCMIVMVAGCYLSIHDIFEKAR